MSERGGALPRVLRTVARAGAAASATAVSLPACYLGVLTVVAPAANSLRRPRNATAAGETRFAVCIPAHDEASVIADAIASLAAQRYPDDLYSVHVVADNCTDDTARVAAAAGAHVHVRVAPDDPGKGPALNWLFDRLDDPTMDERERFDVIVVMDADTVAESDLLAAFDAAFDTDVDAAQGYYGVRDPHISPTVALRYAALACRHHVRPLGRNALGASCGLFGNGMAFRRELLEDHRWTGHLVEDAELQLELLLEGTLVTYVPAARIAAEMPATSAQASSQHQRWELGRAQLVSRYLRPLVLRVARGGPLPRRAYVDAVADLLLPPLSLLAVADLVVLAGAAATLGFDRSGTSRFAVATAAVATGVLGGHVLFSLRSVRAPRSVYRALMSTPGLLLWKVGTIARVARRPDDVTWARTARNAEVTP